MPNYRYDLDNFPSGASRTTSVCPNKAPFGVFRDNVAHSCNEFGLRIWETYQPFVSPQSFILGTLKLLDATDKAAWSSRLKLFLTVYNLHTCFTWLNCYNYLYIIRLMGAVLVNTKLLSSTTSLPMLMVFMVLS